MPLYIIEDDYIVLGESKEEIFFDVLINVSGRKKRKCDEYVT